MVTLKAPITTVADNIFKYVYISVLFFKEISLDISCESFAKLMIHIKCQDLFSLKKKKKKLNCLLQILLGALRVILVMQNSYQL